MISTLCVTRYRTLNRIATKAERIRAMIGFLCLLLTLFTYWISKKMYQRWNWSLLSPLLVCPIILIALLLGLGTSYETYETGGHWLTELLNLQQLLLHGQSINTLIYLRNMEWLFYLMSLFRSFLSVITSALLANYFQIDSSLEHSLAPHIVTTPIAMAISEMIGGMSQLAVCCFNCVNRSIARTFLSFVYAVLKQQLQKVLC